STGTEATSPTRLSSSSARRSECSSNGTLKVAPISVLSSVESGIGAAYDAAGYKPSSAAATRLSKNVKLQERVAEIQAASAERATVTRQWMLERLKQNVERCMTAMPVLDR